MIKSELEERRIAKTGLKADLHIHSYYSKHKEKDNKILNNTLDNIGVLISKLNDNKVNICSITDHDVFSFNIYKKLKEEEGKGSIEKVLPGIEFSVAYTTDKSENKVIHVITIFDDSNEESLKSIEDIVGNFIPKYKDDKEYFSELEYLEILKKINLNVLMIAHQKNTLVSETKRENDANTVGANMFNEFLFSDYFEAYEFRNKKNELFNKKYIYENNFENILKFITGSDCHDWSVYPKQDKLDSGEVPFTYFKCLPSFKGLVMCFTDFRRIKLNNSFFNVSNKPLENIKIMHNELEIEIPLSKGINVLIGDNSIGKSLFLHEMTDYIKEDSNPALKKVRKGYEDYLKENNLYIPKVLDSRNLFSFDMQGEIREKFENKKLKYDTFLKHYFMKDIDTKTELSILENEVSRLINAICESYKIVKLKENLPQIVLKIDYEGMNTLNIKCDIALDNSEIENVTNIINKIKHIEQSIIELTNFKLEIEDKDYFDNIIIATNLMKKKYEDKKKALILKNKIINIIILKSDEFNKELIKNSTDYQKALIEIDRSISIAKVGIVKLYENEINNIEFKPRIKPITIEPLVNKIYQYNFVTKVNQNIIDNKYFIDILNSNFKKGVKLSTKSLTKEQFIDKMLRFSGDANSPENFLKERMIEQFRKDLTSINIINKGDSNTDIKKEMSSGFNQAMYFDLLTYDSKTSGVYVVDQPEDNVSQNAITTYLLDRFKTMSEFRQIILVTHNPQFIINLDVDNVIFLSKDDQGLKIKSGAIEFENDEYSILKVVADNIEGGIETIKKRWKRYEKTISI